MTAILLAVAPIFALIALGWALRRWLWPSADFWASIELLTYYVFFPALLITTLAQARITWEVVPFLSVVVGVGLAVAGLLTVIRPLLRIDGPGYTSVFQGSIRFNTYLGLATASALFGSEAVALLALAIAMMIFPVNILSIAVLARHAAAAPPGMAATLSEVARNPLIISSVAGLGFGALNLPLPPVIGPVLDILAKAALPLGLVAVGAGLNLGTVAARGTAVTVATALKLIVSPLLSLAAARLLNLDPLAATIAVLCGALPPAPASYIMARRLGGDHQLMAALITVHTLLAAITMPLFLALVR